MDTDTVIVGRCMFGSGPPNSLFINEPHNVCPISYALIALLVTLGTVRVDHHRH